jgi:hypothetical protein
MRSRRVTLPSTADPELVKQLTYLYDRRSTLDNLIRSLERYEQCQEEAIEPPRLKSA